MKWVVIRKNKKRLGEELNRITHYMKCLKEKTITLEEVVNNLKVWMGSSKKYLFKHQYDYILNHIKDQYTKKILQPDSDNNL